MEKLFEQQATLALFLAFFVPGFLMIRVYDLLVPTERRDFSKSVFDAFRLYSFAFDVVTAWGFEYKTLLTWMKDRMGTGEWLRGQTEHCLLAARGKPVFLHGNDSTALEATRREHSRKPEEFYALVERAARVAGWNCSPGSGARGGGRTV